MFQRVCLKCGSPAISAPRIESFVPGAGEVAGMYSCRKCGYTGVPLEVNNAEKYKKHLKRRRLT